MLQVILMSSELNKNTKIVDVNDVVDYTKEDNCYGYFSTYEKNAYVHICESSNKSNTKIVDATPVYKGCILYSILTSRRRSSTLWRSGPHTFFYTADTTFGQLCDDIRKEYGVVVNKKLLGKEKDDVQAREW